jgi:hypothetical protein
LQAEKNKRKKKIMQTKTLRKTTIVAPAPVRKSNARSVTLFYDESDMKAKFALDLLLSAGYLKKELTPFEKSLEDIKYGRVTRVKNIDNVIEEILQ